MAIYHCSTKPVTRATGRSSVAAAAYRSGARLTNERDGITHDFRAKRGVDHSEIVVPSGKGAEWALDRSALWNAVEKAEKRRDARVAREFEIALPHELSADEHVELTRAFARDLAERYGTAVDFAIHKPDGDSDIRNVHAHLLMTTRAVSAEGLGEKTNIERANKELLPLNLPTSQMQIVDIRRAWESHANEALARAGYEERIDHRSHQDRGLEIEPTQHMGVHANQMSKRGIEVERTRLDADAARRNAELIREKPEQVLTLITGEKSVFDRHDIARALHRYIDDPEDFQNAFAKVMTSPALTKLRDEGEGGELAKYSTKEMVEIERGMADSADRMAADKSYDSSRALMRFALDQAHGKHALTLSDEQMQAVRHVVGSERIACVVGLAGAGKSTALHAARQIWESQGYRVHGAAMAGIAAEGLEESAGISSRTLASWEHGWKSGRGELGRGDILVIDEAGMVSSRQLARIIDMADRAGAKVVLVGDAEQLQPINAGAAFRALMQRIGCVDIKTVRRQEKTEDRQASVAFGTGRTADGLRHYAKQGAIRANETVQDARADLVARYVADRTAHPDHTRIALAHRRVDVRAINEAVREDRKAKGELGEEVRYRTAEGSRSLSVGDRFVFLENDRRLGVKNGRLGTVEKLEANEITVRLDGKDGRTVTFSPEKYASFDHGYATTIHKSQGATVDRAYVLASSGMDRHLAYVAMTRHRKDVEMFVGRDEFKDMEALEKRLSRSQAKETTLDYLPDYAGARGIVVEDRAEAERPARIEDRGRPDQPQTAKPRWYDRLVPAALRAAGERRDMTSSQQDHTQQPQPENWQPTKTAAEKEKIEQARAELADKERQRLSDAERQHTKNLSYIRDSLTHYERESPSGRFRPTPEQVERRREAEGIAPLDKLSHADAAKIAAELKVRNLYQAPSRWQSRAPQQAKQPMTTEQKKAAYEAVKPKAPEVIHDRKAAVEQQQKEQAERKKQEQERQPPPAPGWDR